MSDFSELKRLAEAAVKEACAAKLGNFPCLPPCTSLSEFRAMASPEFILELLAGIGRAIEDRELFAKVARHQRARRSWWINNCCAAESRLHDVSAACATTEQERDHLKVENGVLRRVATELRNWAECEHVHHSKSEHHEHDEPCKVLARIDAAMSKGAQP